MYNQDLKPLAPELADKIAMYPIRYKHALAIANVLYDLHRELDKPLEVRFRDYPQKEMEPLHMEIYQSLVNLTLAMEAQYRDMKGI